ncbi:MAG: hypothetical protein ABIT38_02365 [Gemmatimonadaceae bacterium]
MDALVGSHAGLAPPSLKGTTSLGGAAPGAGATGPMPEHRREPLPARDDPPVRGRPVLGFDRQVTLAFVHIQADGLDGN